MSNVDQRSVSEVLIEADQLARTILMDVRDLDAARMVRTWGEVVQAAGELWQVLPVPSREVIRGEVVFDQADSTMQRLEAMTLSRYRRQSASWPGNGPGDERHLDMAASFARAEQLIANRVDPHVGVRTVEGIADVHAVKTRIMHTLYVGGHGVTLATGNYLRELEAQKARDGNGRLDARIGYVRPALAHAAAFERIASSVVAKTYPGALTGEHQHVPMPNRLAQALASWDISSHRALTGSTHTADLTAAARTQALILGGSNFLLRGAAEGGFVDPDDHRARLEPALSAAQAGWETLGGKWADLTVTSHRRLHPELARSLTEVRAALREVLHDGAAVSSAAVIAQRTDLSQVPIIVGQVLAANLDLAHLTKDAVANPELVGPSQAVHAMLVAARGDVRESPQVADIDAQALAINRAVPLPPIVRAELGEDCDSLAEASAAAMRAGAQLDYTDRMIREPAVRGGRATQDRKPANLATAREGLRCER